MSQHLPVWAPVGSPSDRGGRLRRHWGAVIRLLLVLMLGGVIGPACGRPTPAGSPMPLPDSYIVADDFSRPNPAWARFDTEESAVYAVAGELFLEDRGQGTSVYTPLIGQEHDDVAVHVDLRHVQGSVNNWMGVLCRMQDENNYYLLAISADGYYLIMKVVEGESVPLVGPEYSEIIRPGKAENRLQARCDGVLLKLQVNDEELATTADTTFREPGGVALFADAVRRGDIVVVAFDNFVLASP
ncbi:MAG: hypothetical protein ACP5HS_02825 [Anaerolineae bacterium]